MLRSATTILIGTIIFASSSFAAGLSADLQPPGSKKIGSAAVHPTLKSKPVISKTLGHATSATQSKEKKNKKKSATVGAKPKEGVKKSSVETVIKTPANRAAVKRVISPPVKVIPQEKLRFSTVKPPAQKTMERPAGKSSAGNATEKGMHAPLRSGGFAPTKSGGAFAPSVSKSASGSAADSSASGSSRSTGGFAPPGVGHGFAGGTDALSPQEIREIGNRSGSYGRFKTSFQASIEAARRRVAERQRLLSEEAYRSGADCDDRDPEIRPDLLEVCDHKDNNCDGRIDEGVTTLMYADLDGDGHGDRSTALDVCPSDIREAQSRGDWLVNLGNDCNDHDPDHWHDCPAP